MDLHSVSGWSVAVVLATIKISAVVELELFFKRKSIELPTQSKLAIDFFLADVEVLYVEEACNGYKRRPEGSGGLLTDMSDGVFQLLDKGLLSSWLLILTKVKGNKLGPVDYQVSISIE